jgi:hypothetical protein
MPQTTLARITESMKSFDNRERRLKAPVAREKKAINTRALLEDAEIDDYFGDEDEETNTSDSDDEATE